MDDFSRISELGFLPYKGVYPLKAWGIGTFPPTLGIHTFE